MRAKVLESIEGLVLEVMTIDGRSVEDCYFWILRLGELDLYLVKNNRLTLAKTIRNVICVGERR